MKKYKIIAICGKAGAGKDTLLREIVSKYKVHDIISCTTRPKREGEIEGADYFYLTREDFLKKVMNDDMLEATSFNNWFYGTMKQGLDKEGWNIGVFNPEGIEYLCANPDVETSIFYLDVKDKIRLIRQLDREVDPDVHEIIRRFSTDEKDFMMLQFDYEMLPNNNHHDLQNAISVIASICGLQVKSN